ncbi:hypothetical protein ACRC7T_18235 [Segnochrobactraceae bacterium EtOH-i3]
MRLLSLLLALALATAPVAGTGALAATGVKTERIIIAPQADRLPSGPPVVTDPTPDPGAAPAEEAAPPADNPEDLEGDVQRPRPPRDPQAYEGPLPEVHYGVAGLPDPVARTRQALIDAAKTGDIEALRAVFAQSPQPPIVSSTTVDDPVLFLKKSSGDEEGREILAILIELLESGWSVRGAGTPQETYVWPYFADYPLDAVTARQEVELYRILTAADVEEMRAYGEYLFYSVGIAPDGRLVFFKAED